MWQLGFWLVATFCFHTCLPHCIAFLKSLNGLIQRFALQKCNTMRCKCMLKWDVAPRPQICLIKSFQSMLFAPFLKREKSQKRRNSLFFLFSEGVEKCIPWNHNLTQQIDLAFNIFFMVYFFIRVSCRNYHLTQSLNLPQQGMLSEPISGGYQ
jgi:hypothetical protein